MKKKVAIILNSFAIVLVFACTIALSFAWYTNSNDIDVSLQGGSAGGYFRGGSGTATDPYEIANSRHMYNFAWLQNNGKYVDSNGNQTKMYFELVNADGNNGVIDMEGVAIPPIGNDDLPFIGEFNGNGCTISNLIVSTHYDVIYNGDVLRQDKYEFSNAVGLFGMTGTGSVIKNFILNDPIVEVYDGNDTIYDASGAKVVGIAIGYVENIASSIGIIGGTLANRRQENYSSYNNIIGSMSETAKGNMNITGETTSGGSGGDIGYFVPDKILSNINSNSSKYPYENYGTITKSNGNITKIAFTENIAIAAENKNELGELGLGSFSILPDKSTTETDAISTTSSYFKSFTKIYFRPPQITQDSSGTVSYDFFYNKPSSYKDYWEIDLNRSVDYSNDTNKVGDVTKESVQSNVKYVKEELTSLTAYLTFKARTAEGEYTPDLYYEDATKATNESRTYNQDSCICVNISSASPSNPSIVFLIATPDGSRNYRTLQLINDSGDQIGCLYMPGTSDASGGDDPGNYATGSKVNDNYNSAIACYFHITEPGKYYIANTSGRGAILYLSVLGVELGQESTGTYEEDKMISGIDFITSDVTIVQTEGEEQYQFTNISDINQTNTFVYTKVKASFNSNMNGVTLYFKREDETISALLIEIYPDKNNLTTTGSGTCTVTVVNQDLTLE